MNLQSTKILVIDDDPKFRILTNKILTSQGAVVKECEDLNSAFDYLKNNIPDLILLDLQLSNDVHGSEFLKIRNTVAKLARIPVIICSSDNRREMVTNVIDLGVNDYIIKPYRPDWLIKKIYRCLKEQDAVAFTFTEPMLQQKITVSCEADLIALGEASCIIRSPISFSRLSETKITLEGISEYMKKNDVKIDFNPQKICRSNFSSRPSAKGQYDTLLTLLGVSEKEAHEIRKLKSGWADKK